MFLCTYFWCPFPYISTKIDNNVIKIVHWNRIGCAASFILWGGNNWSRGKAGWTVQARFSNWQWFAATYISSAKLIFYLPQEKFTSIKKPLLPYLFFATLCFLFLLQICRMYKSKHCHSTGFTVMLFWPPLRLIPKLFICLHF